MVGENGKIVFKASKDTVLDTASVTTATGEGKGGEIQVLGERIGLFGNAKVDASGKTGGGTVLVGGDYQGKNHDVPNAATTYFGRNAEIKADAIDNGDGGKVIVWADDTTKAYGRISARGGDQSGNGGLVETSGKRSLVFRSRVDTGARNGKAGRLLLDPLDITVADGAGGADDALLSDNLIGAGEPNTTTNVTISEQALEALSGTVTLQASGNVIFNNLTDDLISLSNVTNFTVSAGGGVTAADVNDRIVTSGGSVSIIAGGGNVDIGGVKSGGGAVSISATGNAIVREIVTMPGGGNAGNISISSGGLMTLGGGHIDARGAGGSAGNVTLTSGGAIGMQTGKTIYGNQLKMTAAGGIYGTTAADPMSTQVSTLNARNTGSSDIKISNSGGNLSIADIGTVGYGVKQDAVGGVVELATDATRTLDINAPIRSQGGAISLAGPGGINLHASSQPEISSNGGMISLAASDAGAKISTDAGTQINSNGGSIALQADKMQLLGSMNATSSGIVKLAPQAGTAIHLGTVNTDLTNATLELSNTELGGIAAGTVLVGDANSGAIDVKSTLSTGFAAMGLTSAGAITQQPGALLGGALSFKLAGSSVNLPEANPTGVIAGSTSGGNFTYRSANAINVSTVDGLSGINAGVGSVKLISDHASGINQNAPIVADGLLLQTIGPVMLQNTGNNVAKIAADLSLGNTGSGTLAFYNSNNLASDTVLAVNGITTNNKEVSLATASGKTLTVTQAIDAGTGGVGLTADALSLNNTVTANRAMLRNSTAGRNITLGAAACVTVPCLAITDLSKIVAPSVAIGSMDTGLPTGSIDVVGVTNSVALVTDRNASTTRLGLLSAGTVNQTGTIDVQDLGVRAGSTVNLNQPNTVTNLAGTSSGNFTFVNANALTVGSMSGGTANFPYALNGIVTGNGNASLTASTGNLNLPNPIVAGTGAVSLTANAGAIAGSGGVSGAGLTLSASGGMNLSSAVSTLSALNSGANSNISITNSGALTLNDVQQTTPGSTGSITINNFGAMNVAAGKTVSTDGGSITLHANSPLTVNNTGTVQSASGNITLQAGPTGSTTDKLTINGKIATAPGANVAVSTTGAILLQAGDAITITDTVSGNVTQNPYMNQAAAPAPAPTLAECTANPKLAGCTKVLPTLDACTADPTLAGCTAVLPTLDACTTDPKLAGCTAVLPTLNACTTDPKLAGCTAVLPTLNACTTDPKLAGCTAVLPTLDACTTDPKQAGCTVVLPALDACTVDSKLAGCTVVLPTLSTCTAMPTLAGCTAVLPTVLQCTSAPTLPGCAVVLPSLSQCTTTPTLAGCSVVLPTLSQCTDTLSGCAAVLPPTQTNGGGTGATSPDTSPESIKTATESMVHKFLAVTTAATESVRSVATAEQGTTGGGGAASSSDNKKNDEKKSAAGPKDKGVEKNESAKKMYCN